MSVPFIILVCSTCDTEWSSLMLHGYFEYWLLDGLRISAERCMGWRNNCRSIEVVESLPNKSDTIARLNEAENNLSTAIAHLPATFFQRLSWRFRTKRKSKIESAINNRRVEVSRYQAKLKFLDSRIDAEKCFECGCVDIIKYDEIPKFSSEEYRSIAPKTKATSYMHPICGDRLSVRTSGGVRISAEYPKANLRS